MPLLRCAWCGAANADGPATCGTCGAPLRDAPVSPAWREAPRLRERHEIRFGSGTCVLEGELVPVAELQLAAGDAVCFDHRVLLWKDDDVAFAGVVRQRDGAALRTVRGPGRAAFSRHAPGEIVVLALEPGASLDLREHALLVGSATLSTTWDEVGNRRDEWGSSFRYLSHLTAGTEPATVLLYGQGNVRQRSLGPDERIQVQARNLLYKDPSVAMALEQLEVPGARHRTVSIARLTGPGRVGIQTVSTLYYD